MNLGTDVSRRQNLGPADIVRPVTLGREVFDVNHVVVVKGQVRHAEGRELQGYLPADGAHANDHGPAIPESVRRHESPLANIAARIDPIHSMFLQTSRPNGVARVPVAAADRPESIRPPNPATTSE